MQVKSSNQAHSACTSVQVLIFAHLCSAVILAFPACGSEPMQSALNAEECDDDAADVFLPKKRDRRIWFDVPNRGGIGMIHMTKRKCPEIMFKYLDHQSREQGRGWKFHMGEDNEAASPIQVMRTILRDLSRPHHVLVLIACIVCPQCPYFVTVTFLFPQPRQHQLRSSKFAFPPSPASLPPSYAGMSPRAFGKGKGKDIFSTPTIATGFSSSHVAAPACASGRSTRSGPGRPPGRPSSRPAVDATPEHGIRLSPRGCVQSNSCRF